MPLVTLQSIETVSLKVLVECGVPKDEARIITNSILFAHKRGKETHGITRLPIYERKIRMGLMSPITSLSLIKQSTIISVLDANHGFGQVSAYKGMEISIDKAREHGIGVTGIRNSNNFATAGFIAELAVKQNMIGIVLSNSAPAIAPWGGNKPLLGTNPIGIAFPDREGEFPIILDMATSIAARGKIRLAAKNNEAIPLGWALDEQGNPTNDPLEAIKGSMIPIGGHKGFGLSLVVDILAGLLTGSGFGGDVKPLSSKDGYSKYGHFLAAIDIGAFMEVDEFFENIDQLKTKFKDSSENKEVYLPGEKSWKNGVINNKNVLLGSQSIDEINNLCKKLNLTERIKTSV